MTNREFWRLVALLSVVAAISWGFILMFHPPAKGEEVSPGVLAPYDRDQEALELAQLRKERAEHPERKRTYVDAQGLVAVVFFPVGPAGDKAMADHDWEQTKQRAREANDKLYNNWRQHRDAKYAARAQFQIDLAAAQPPVTINYTPVFYAPIYYRSRWDRWNYWGY